MVEAERQRLIDLARAQGATDDEVAEALATGELGALALERALYPRGNLVPFTDAVAEAGIDPDDASRFFRSLGFPDPSLNPPLLSPPEVELLKIMVGVGLELLGRDATDQIARVVGSATFRIAESVVDAFRLQAEVPQQEAGVAYSEIATGFVDVAKEIVPKFGSAIGALFMRHMIEVIYSNWSVDEGGGAITLQRTVGFADLVGYTASATALSGRELAAIVDRFEERVATAVARHDGRLVKLIGDEAMFVADSPDIGCAIAEDLVGEFGEGIRVGLAQGSVVTLRGDYYGEVVNLASRLTAASAPGTVLVAASVTSDSQAERFEFAGDFVLKGFRDPVSAYRLR